MKNAWVSLLLAAAAAAGGCRRGSETAAAFTNAPPAAPPPLYDFSAPFLPAATPATNAVVIEVNGQRLTRAEADNMVEVRLAGIPPERREQERERLRNQAVEQFVARTLLLEEADRRGIRVTPEDEARALRAVQARLPAGVTVEEAMRRSPVGPERMRAEILAGVRISKLAAEEQKEAAQIADAEVAALRLSLKDAIAKMPETVHARHILIRTAPTDDEAARTRKRQKAEEIRAALVAGADFGETAEKQSEHPSRQRGGDLGTFPRQGQPWGAAFLDAAFRQATNEIGAVVEDSGNGFHIIQVLEHNPAGSISDAGLREMIRMQKQQRATRDLVRELRAKAKIKDFRTPASPALPLRPAGSVTNLFRP